MRDVADAARIGEFMRRLGGATAVLLGWRPSTIDVDVKFVPDRDDIFRAIPELKESLNFNVELACPTDFIPPLPDWESRCLHVAREGRIDWYHFDPYAQALAKIERGHAQDDEDVAAFLSRGLVEPARLRELFRAIEPALFRYPAVDPAAFARRVDAALP